MIKIGFRKSTTSQTEEAQELSIFNIPDQVQIEIGKLVGLLLSTANSRNELTLMIRKETFSDRKGAMQRTLNNLKYETKILTRKLNTLKLLMELEAEPCSEPKEMGFGVIIPSTRRQRQWNDPALAIYMGPIPKDVAVKAKRLLKIVHNDNVRVYSNIPEHFQNPLVKGDPLLLVKTHIGFFRVAIWGLEEELRDI